MVGKLICFVCGNPGADARLCIRQRDRGPYFPFLEHHDPPKGSRPPASDGMIDSCHVCYAFLRQQWETYERTNTPAIKRLYWLKRSDNGQFTGAEMRLQGEYIAQVMGLQYQPGVFDETSTMSEDSRYSQDMDYSRRHGKQNEQRVSAPQYMPNISSTPKDFSVFREEQHLPRPQADGALDLSVSKNDSVQQTHSDKQRVGDRGSSAKYQEQTFVCYICTQEHSYASERLINVFKPAGSEPYFPVLEKIPHPNSADCVSKSGQVRVCCGCKNILFQQWQAYEMSGVPIQVRTYRIPDELAKAPKNQERHVTENRKESVSISQQSRSIGKIQVCYICGQSCSHDQCKLLNTLPPKSPTPATLFFPFVRELKRPSGAEPLTPSGSVVACNQCYGHLSYQWQVQEMEGVPLYHRQYSLGFFTELQEHTDSRSASHISPCISNGSGEMTKPLNIQITGSSPMMSNEGSAPSFSSSQGLLTIAAPLSSSLNVSPKRSSYRSSPSRAKESESKKQDGGHGSTEGSSSSKTIPHPLQQVSAMPKKVCFLCGEKCLITKMHYLLSYPVKHETKSANNQVEPFFPFLANRDPAHGAEPVNEEGKVKACNICFFTLLKQWTDFEQSKNPNDSNRWLRKYTLPIYVCYVCGSPCERKYVRTLAVRKFHFLKEHKASPNSMVLDNGERIAVCKPCAYSLMQQHGEFERMGVPHELRKFNWIQHTSAAYDSTEDCDVQDEIGEHVRHPKSAIVSSLNEDYKNATSNLQETPEGTRNSESGLPPGSKPPPLNMMSPAGSKIQRNTATVSPLHQVSTSPTNGVTSLGASAALNAARTSSFAAALRKLAHQVKDPAEEQSLKSAPAGSPRETTPKRVPPPLVYSSHSSTTLTSPPVVTIAPTQSHLNLLSSDARTIQFMFQTLPERTHSSHSNSSLFEPVPLKSDRERSHSSLSRDDDRAASRDNLSQSARRMTPHSTPGTTSPMMSREEARGFQPYRPGDDLRHTSLPTSLAAAMDPSMAAVAAAAAAYQYPNFLHPHAFPHPAFRFDDPLLLERYRLMHPPYMPYPPGSMLTHPGLHPFLTSGRYPAELLHPQFPFVSQSGRLSEHRSPSVHSDRQRLEDEKMERDREREKERELQERERHRATERESEREKPRDRSAHRENRDQEKRPGSAVDKSKLESLTRERSLLDREDPLSTRFGSIIQGTPRGIADRYPPVPHTSSSTPKGRNEERRASTGDAQSGGYSKNASTQKRFSIDDLKQTDADRRYSLVNPIKESDRSHGQVSPKLNEDQKNIIRKSPESGGLFRPFDSKHVANSYNGILPNEPEIYPGKGDNSKSSFRIGSSPMKQKDNTQDIEKDISQDIFSKKESSLSNHIVRLESTLKPENLAEHNKDLFISSSNNKELPPLETLNNLNSSKLTDSSSICNFSTNKESLYESQCGNREYSKLDFEEQKIQEARANGIYCSDSECEEEVMREEERSLQRLLLITTGPPMQLDTSAKKMKLFKAIGLTSHQRRKDHEFNKLRHRRRLHRERSTSPIQMEDEPVQPVLEPPQIDPDNLCRETDYPQKCEFLKVLDLMALSREKRKIMEQILSVCDDERRRRNSVIRTGVKRKLDEEASPEDDKSSEEDTTNRNSVDQIGGVHLRTDLHVSHSFGVERDPSFVKNNVTDARAILYPESNRLQLSKRFAQEFHQSVLETTRLKEKKQKLDPTGDSTNTFSSNSNLRHVTEISGTIKPAFPIVQTSLIPQEWPGVEGLMESYHKHNQEIKLERQILLERTKKLQGDNMELNKNAEILNKRIEELLKAKQQLEEEKYQKQSRIENLKKTLKHYR
ncbi:hypothetical protein CHS0354_003535 [Potamilus streckersoni]|uniref:Genetic suppressor element-like domain-containing protein n=1 Tax=Potamilus streckersoni TaxID=2493646 RepID=A0AAE0RV85_9BIVA|nr:hypothetical protein CHS0354_003535 [Potamilus streckersoni]